MFANLLTILSDKPTLAGSIVTAIVAAITAAIVQYFSQKRLKNREAQTNEALKRLELELKRQGDQVQTQFSAAHKARDEIAAIFLDNVLQAERALGDYFRKGDDFKGTLDENRRAMDYQRARAEIYFSEDVAKEFAVIVILVSLTEHHVFALHHAPPANLDELNGQIKEYLFDALPKQRTALGKKLKCVLLPTEPTA